MTFTTGPTHVLVPNKAAAASLKNAVSHVYSRPLPAGSFVRMDGNTLLCSPELCFVQMASRLSLVELIKLGFELCSTYTVQPDGSVQFNRALPVTTLHALAAYLDRCPNMPGIALARKAMQFLSSVSASPMETAVTMVLCLPPRYGGYGLPLPCMNYRVEPRKNQTTGIRKNYYVCDLFWPGAGVCLEYDSNQEHTGALRIAEDAQRRNDLAAMKIATVTATCNQVTEAASLERMASQIAQALGVRLRKERTGSPYSHVKLLRSLMMPSTFRTSWTKSR